MQSPPTNGTKNSNLRHRAEFVFCPRFSTDESSRFLLSTFCLERFSIECRKTQYAVNHSELEANTCKRRQARENACEQGAIGIGLTSYWMRNWREFCKQSTERSKAKLKQTRITLETQNTQLKTTNCALIG